MELGCKGAGEKVSYQVIAYKKHIRARTVATHKGVLFAAGFNLELL